MPDPVAPAHSDAAAARDSAVDSATARDAAPLSDAPTPMDAMPLTDVRVGADVVTPSDVVVAPDAGPPAFRVVGRADYGDPAGPRFEWPGTSIVARFMGTQASVRLNDGGNYFRVAIDGVEQPLLIGRGGTMTYSLATGLSSGVHSLELWRRTESFGNVSQVFGFDFGAGGELLPPAPAATRHIELVGDSISCGASNEGSDPTCMFTFATENNYLSYGPVTARALNAELHIVAWSGYGMYRGGDGDLTHTVPSLYDRALTQSPPADWDFARWTPDVVVINLGTNDFAPGDPGQAYTDAYVAFVRRVRGHYPGAYILASIGPMTLAPGPRIRAALDVLRASGETHTGYLEFTTPSGEWGCGYHPNVVADQAMADELTAALRTALGW